MDNRALFIVARILIPMVFVGLGAERLLIAGGVLAGPPVSTGAAVFSAFELVAGLLVMVGWKVRWIAGLLAAFIVADAYLAHAFWAYPAAERHGQLLHFLKNLATLGGLLLLIWADARERSRSRSDFAS
jgi:putative oxidoreductase